MESRSLLASLWPRGLRGLGLPAALGSLLVAAAAYAGGADVSSDAIYSDHVALAADDGRPLDIDDDGNVDLAVASNSDVATEASRYYPGNGDGTFAAPVLLGAGASSEIAIGDLNGDMLLDLVQGRRDLTNLLYLADGAGVAAGLDVTADADHTLSVALGDLDLDGDLDVVAGNGIGGTSGLPQRNRFYINDIIGGGTQTFTGADIALDADVTRSIVLADIDGDGDLDVLAGNDETTAGSNRVYLLAQTVPLVVFAPGIDFGPPDDQTSKILVGDLDGDLDLDVVTLNFVSPASPGVNRFFINTGTFGLAAATDVSTDADSTTGGALADFDGDGDLDLAVANLSGPNRLYLNEVDGPGGAVSFAPGIDISPDEHMSRELAALDLNGDGDIDIVVGNQDQPDLRFLNNGTADPFTNLAPVIDAAEALSTGEGEALTITLGDITVTDADNVFPDDFTLTVQPGANYTAVGNTITPAPGFAVPLSVPVVVSDGTDDSEAFSVTVNIVPAPRSGGSGGGSTGVLPLLALLILAGARGFRRAR